MAAPIGTAQHDLGSLRIHDGQRRGSKVGKGLAIFFGVLVILAGIGGGVYRLGTFTDVLTIVEDNHASTGGDNIGS